MVYSDEAVFVLKYQEGQNNSVYLVKHADTLSDASQITTSLQLTTYYESETKPKSGHVSVAKYTDSDGDVLDHTAVCITNTPDEVQIWSEFIYENDTVKSEYTITSDMLLGCEAINAGSDGKSYAITVEYSDLLKLVTIE